MIALSERLNPVIVKDVRQALRGKLFRVVFVINLSLAMVAAIFALVQLSDRPQADDSGLTMFAVGHGIFAICSMVLVPLLANRGMAAERDDKSLDALLISGLSTAQIVRGKWLGSTVLLGLFLSSTAPFLALGYTLYGLDVLVSLTMLTFTTLIGAGCCLAGILLASLSVNRTLDTLVLGAQLMASVGLAIGWMNFVYFLMDRQLSSTSLAEFLIGTALWMLVLAAVICWLFAVCVALLAHAEENASTRLRINALAVQLAGVVACVVLWFLFGPDDDVIGLLAVLMVLWSAGLISVVTEGDALRRRMALELREGRWRWPGAWLLLPGGGRGMALYLIGVATLAALGLIPVALDTRNADDMWFGLAMMAVVCATYVGLPAWLNSLAPRTRAQLVRMRILMLLLPLGVTVFTMLIGVMIGDHDIADGQAHLNPFWAIVEAFDDGWNGQAKPAFVLHGTLALVALMLNLQRMLTGRGEVRAQRLWAAADGPGAQADDERSAVVSAGTLPTDDAPARAVTAGAPDTTDGVGGTDSDARPT